MNNKITKNTKIQRKCRNKKYKYKYKWLLAKYKPTFWPPLLPLLSIQFLMPTVNMVGYHYLPFSLKKTDVPSFFSIVHQADANVKGR